MKRIVLPLTVLVFLLLVWACASDNEEDRFPPDPVDTTLTLCDTFPAVVSFSDTILPIIERYCSDPSQNAGCHAAGGVQSPPLVDHPSIKGQVDMGRIQDRVLARVPSPMPPSGEPTLTECERILLDRWIKDGAPNN